MRGGIIPSHFLVSIAGALPEFYLWDALKTSNQRCQVITSGPHQANGNGASMHQTVRQGRLHHKDRSPSRCLYVAFLSYHTPY